MNLKCCHFIGVVFTLVVGTLLHFTYELSGKSPFVGIFSAVNESTWEHLKLLFVPVLLFAIGEYLVYGNKIPNFVPVKVLSILFGMIIIVIVFYTYTGIAGQHFLWADITTFILGVLAAYWFSYRFLQTEYFYSAFAIRLGWLGLFLLMFCFALFTFMPPHAGLFLDPVSGTYGI